METVLLKDAQFPATIVSTPITVAMGDGVGPEIMTATLRILEHAGAPFSIEKIAIGESVYLNGHTSGISADAWESIRRTKLLLKGPVTTPQGGGYKSLNVTLRKVLGLYANVRPSVAYAPFVPTQFPKMNVVVVRENEEDLYAGIEHRQTDEVFQCLKLISRPGCERIMRYAFEYARANSRFRVTCMTKDNIMKLTDGLFHKVFDEIGLEYPEITKDHQIIDIGMARAATQPEKLDVVVTLNLYGDILSDVLADVAGSVGLAGSANIGTECAMFEAIHGSAPDIAGKDIANPSGLLMASLQMLTHIGQAKTAEAIHNAWLKTIEDGIHTRDILGPKTTEEVGTQRFADAVLSRLGQDPKSLSPVRYSSLVGMNLAPQEKPSPAEKKMVGVDVFVAWRGSADDLATALSVSEQSSMKLSMITNRGVKVWPNGLPETFLTDHWRCRFQTDPNGSVNHSQVAELLTSVAHSGLDFIKCETLCEFNGQPGFSLGQGQ